jgi:hypothetical protein
MFAPSRRLRCCAGTRVKFQYGLVFDRGWISRLYLSVNTLVICVLDVVQLGVELTLS